MYLVTGATGTVGRPVVDGLLAAGAPVRALSRDPATAGLPAGAEVARTDTMPLDGVTAMFLNPAVVWGGAESLLKRAAEHGVARIVLLSSSAALDEDPANAIGAHHRALERQVEESGLAWTFLRPGAFSANTRQWAGQVRAGDVVRAPYGRAQVAPVHEKDIAAVAVRALLDEQLTGTRPVLTGPESLSQADQVRLIGEAVGRPLRFEEIPPETARERMVGGGVPAPIADTLMRMFAAFVDRPADVSPDVERITGRPAATFARWAADHVADFR